MLFECFGEVRAGAEGHCAGAGGDADDESGEGEGGDAEVPASLVVEGEGVGDKEEVEDSVEERHVGGDQCKNWLEGKHDKWTNEVYREKAVECKRCLIGFGV